MKKNSIRDIYQKLEIPVPPFGGGSKNKCKKTMELCAASVLEKYLHQKDSLMN